MTVRVAINGFGRTGRAAFRAAYRIGRRHRVGRDQRRRRPGDARPSAQVRHRLRAVPGTVDAADGDIVVDGNEIVTPTETDPAELPWDELDVDVVIESTGRFRTRADAAKHLEAGAKEGDRLGSGEGARTSPSRSA